MFSKSQIKQNDVDFHQYYKNGKLEELKCRMDNKCYPPRCKVKIQAKHKDFFAKSSRNVKFYLKCNAHTYEGMIAIPCNGGKNICTYIYIYIYIYIYGCACNHINWTCSRCI